MKKIQFQNFHANKFLIKISACVFREAEMISRSVIVILLASSVIVAEIEEIAFKQESLQYMKNHSKSKTLTQTVDKRIFGGEPAILGQFPYQVLIYVVSNVNDTCCSKF